MRLFHWALLFAVATSWIAVEVFDDTELHLKSGQLVLGLLIFRVLWGFFGPASAQFHRFIRRPGTVWAYARGKPVSYVGHNPLGALSVVAMLASLVVQVITGLCSDDEIFTTGPLAQFLTEEQVALANWVHEWNKYVLLLLIATHVLAILFYLIRKNTNLVWPMISGRGATGSGGIRQRPAWLAILTIVAAAAVAWQVFLL